MSISRPPEERLLALVRAEEKRVLSEAQLAADPARLAAGWERRFVIERPRVAELLRLYEASGYEAVADPLRADASQDEGCAACPVAGALEFCMVYTRRRA